MDRYNNDLRRDRYKGRFRESDSKDSASESLDRTWLKRRSQGPNRYGEEHIKPDDFTEDIVPTYAEEYLGNPIRWSDDSRSEASSESHFGKGPKGYLRSAEKIKDEACEILTRDYQLDASEIEVHFEDHNLILKGRVGSRYDKRRAEALVENIPGVQDVINQIKLKGHESNGWIAEGGNLQSEI